MRFLVDECTGPAVARWLRGRNHEVFSVFDQARGLEDERPASKIRVLSKLLETYSDKVPESIIVVTENQVRLAKR